VEEPLAVLDGFGGFLKLHERVDLVLEDLDSLHRGKGRTVSGYYWFGRLKLVD
jgi:hypothetical protein